MSRALPLSFALAALSHAAAGCSDPFFGAAAEPLGIVRQTSAIQGRDGAQSGLAFGRSVWTFGDTVLNTPDAEGVNWHQNSWSFTTDLDARNGVRALTTPVDAVGAPTYFVAPTPDEAAYNAAHYGSSSCAESPCGARWAAWPGAPLWDAARNRALIFYGLVHAEPGDFNFYGVGQSIAVWSDFGAAPERPVVSPGAAHPTLLFGQDEPSWGTGGMVDGDFLYAFACDTDSSLSPPCSLARVPLDQVLDRQAWRFYDGAGWSTSEADRATIFSGASTLTIEKNAYLGACPAE
jgi:hypothetical protein